MASKPTAKRRRVARRLRDLRAQANLTHEDAAKHLGCGQPKISKMEGAIIGLNADEVRQLAEFYGAPAQTVESLVRLTRESRKRGWYSSYDGTLSSDSLDYMELETDAVSVANFQIDLFPGLTQTGDYARAVIRAADPTAPEELINKRVELRMKRQQLAADNGLSLWAVIGESALIRPVGGAEVHRTQLAHILELAARPGVQFQVLPMRAGEHIAMGVPFSCFRFDDGDGVVAVDHLKGTLYLEESLDVERYRLAFQHLCGAALSPQDSLALMRRYIDKECSEWDRSV
ncbi:helix-turn-helix domain-containing protein [Solihabitans fulvus]|uniref:Helix-turn-helix domain-containing protein n=1 Tax=Solihabitans fulvus TaxID=1892852 RepID=A0A5B2X633_9PSEU|nr:helix-turn-helix transcriptional regulator [Solihabitans fulvus]KAA2258680.1 helix-turn-helix domain-containing protein [Solihabitans fulvus]